MRKRGAYAAKGIDCMPNARCGRAGTSRKNGPQPAWPRACKTATAVTILLAGRTTPPMEAQAPGGGTAPHRAFFHA